MEELTRLADLEQLVGVASTTTDYDGREHTATTETRCAILRAMGHDVASPADAPTALIVERRRREAQVVPTVLVAWEGAMDSPLGCPDGLGWTITAFDLNDPAAAPPPRTGTITDRSVRVDGLEFGFHELTIEVSDHTHTAFVISAPTRAFNHFTSDNPRWGISAHTGGLWSRSASTGGALTHLARAAHWASESGASVISTLPLLATAPEEASPYSPLSRRFFDERVLALEAFGVPERRIDLNAPRDPQADSTAANAAIDELLATTPKYRTAAETHLARNHEVAKWAQFRAAQEMYGQDWRTWPDDARRGHLVALPLDSDRILRHGFVQWAVAEQLTELRTELGKQGIDLALDLPVGASQTSFDQWRRQDVFADGVQIGAPPDPAFPDGQQWGSTPIVPEASRLDHHRTFRESLEAQMLHADVLRLDHVMSLERLWWLTDDPSDGVYVYQPMLELLAIATLMSHRHSCTLIGENLGIVSERMQQALVHHGILGMSVAQFAPTDVPDSNTVATLGTHDLPTLTSWWSAEEQDELRDHLARLAHTTASTPDLPAPVMHQLLERLGHSQAPLVLLPIEELWGGEHRINVPGDDAQANWIGRSTIPIDEWSDEHCTFMTTLNRARSETAGTSWPPPGWWFSADDQHLFNEGSHTRLWHSLGGRLDIVDGVSGVRFAVWAPNARSVSVIGDFNGWVHPGHAMRTVGASGVWDVFIPGLANGLRYKFRIEGAQGRIVEKADPLAFKSEQAPSTASVIADLSHEWDDAEWMAGRGERNRWDKPISIYEVHLGSWRRDDNNPNRLLTYTEHIDGLVDHVATMGFTHVELLPITEHPLYASWGYQTTGYFAATSRYGDPLELMALIEAFHKAGVGVILDWVPSHFPTDEFALNAFDGSQLYEHADPREGFHPDWKSSIFNYGRHEVRSFLLSSARFWLEAFHIDGIRVDAVASMLYRDYSRGDDWVPNRYGGRENLEAIEFLQQLNHEMYSAHPDILIVAEESTAWPGVTKPTDQGGLGFGFKWDMGWMNDSLSYFEEDPVHRRWHHNKLTFRAMYGFSENYVLPLSHDEVVHGKGSLLAKMPGDDWQRFANLRLLFGWQYTTPGKKLLFMGSELAPWTEWNHDAGLPWHLVGTGPHEGVLQWVAQLNALYRDVPALHVADTSPEGFAWIDADDNERSILSFLRSDGHGDHVAVVMNNTPMVREDVMVGVPEEGAWDVIACSDDVAFGGAGHDHPDRYTTTSHRHNAFPQSLWLTLPALSITILRPAPTVEDTRPQPRSTVA
jgi:alpha-1,4-glucan:alpha-1,4-glucan 6-glycosyltransferase